MKTMNCNQLGGACDEEFHVLPEDWIKFEFQPTVNLDELTAAI